MNHQITIDMLLRSRREEPLSPEEWKRIKTRCAWVKEKIAALREAQRARDERCGEAAERLSEEEFERLCDEEQAKVDAIRAQLDDVIERDEWPRELYWGNI
jgi:predicted ATPase with chaperone activity